MFKKKIKIKIKKRFKGRGIKTPTVYLKKPKKITNIVMFRNAGLIGLKIYERLIKSLRKFTKKKKFSLRFKVKSNFIVSKKPTNSRMGKGKGSPKGFILRVTAGSIFLVTKGISLKRLQRFFKKENERTVNGFIVRRVKNLIL